MNDSTNHDSPPRRHWLTPNAGTRGPLDILNRGWLLLVVLMLIIVALGLCGEQGRTALRYQRDAILDRHEYWRLLTAHLVHANWQHVWLNLAGLALMVSLFRRCYSTLQWLGIALFSVLCIDLGFVLLMPQLQWYVGLSGVLHGVLGAGAVAWWRIEDRRLTAVLWSILLGKLTWEQSHGALPLSGELNVIVNAHLYGAIGGVVSGAIATITLMKRPPVAA